MSRNEELAAIFQEIAAVMQYQGESWFKIKAYIDFASTLTGLKRAVEDMTATELEALPGVGRIIREKTHRYLEDGTFPLLERIRKVDPEIRGMLAAGVMPAAVRALEQKAGITSTEALHTASQDGTLSLSGIPTRQRNAIKAFLAEH